MNSHTITAPQQEFSPWTPAERDYLLDDLCRTFARASANEGWFRQSWLGVELWQMPQDLVRLQAVVHQARPRWIIETGTKFGGSAIFFASLLALNGEHAGGVLTVDLHLRAAAQAVFAQHPLGSRVIAALQGDAADPAIIATFAEYMATDPGPVLVFLDDDHNAEHVLRELHGYAPLLGLGDWLIVADTVFADLHGTPVGQPTAKYPDVRVSNPQVAVEQFLATQADFCRVKPPCDHGPGNFSDGFLRRLGSE